MQYILEKTLTETSDLSEVEFRALLDESAARPYLYTFATSVNKMPLFECWKDIQHFQDLRKYRREKLRSICEKYAKLQLLTPLPGSTENEFAAGKTKLSGIDKWHDIDIVEGVDQIFVSLRRCCFHQLHDQIFLPFTVTPEYDAMCRAVLDSYNGVSEDDFECFDEVGEGASALVVHCRKKTTGLNYAMKIQPKYDLLKCCGGTRSKVMQEVQAYTQCKHPYVTSLAYAFQTPTLAVLVMPLALCGDLRRSLGNTSGGRMGLPRVQFYAAEIVVALHYMHSHGIIYRDLKPGNVLLSADGHIVLADFGSLAGRDLML